MLSREEIEELFAIFFKHSEFSHAVLPLTRLVAVHVPLVYGDFHTPELVLQRSQFLCTV